MAYSEEDRLASNSISPTEISDVVRMPNQNVRQLLVSMVKADAIRKAGRGRYLHPDKVDHKEDPHHNDHNITNEPEGPE